MKVLREFIKKYFHFAAFALASAIFALSSFCVTLFGDDCGYYLFASGGPRHLIDSMAQHAAKTNGRTFVHFLDALLLQGDMIPWKIFNSILCASVIFFVALLSSGAYEKENIREYIFETRFKRALTASSALFCALPAAAVSASVLWATGAMNYLFPIALLLCELFFGLRYIVLSRSGAPFAVFAVLCALSVEQASFAAVLFCAAVFAYKRKKDKKTDALVLCTLVLALAASATVFFSRGNSVRMTYYPDFYSLPLFSRILSNLGEWSAVCFSDAALLPICSLSLVFFAFGEMRKGKARKALACVCLLLAGAQIAINVSAIVDTTNGFILTLPLFSALAIMGILLVIDAVKEKDAREAFLFVLSAALQAAMLLSPQYGARTALISIILLSVFVCKKVAEDPRPAPIALSALILCAFLPSARIKSFIALAVFALGAVIALAVTKKKSGVPKMKRVCISAASVCLCLCFLQGALAARGYIQNAPVYIENDRRIEEYLRSGSKSGTLVLVLPKNDLYRYHYPCDGDPYHIVTFMASHGLPADTLIEWE